MVSVGCVAVSQSGVLEVREILGIETGKLNGMWV